VALEDHTRLASHEIARLVADHPRSEGLVLLPDEVSTVGGALVAGFRSDAQALRVAALERNVPVEVALPAGAQPGQYTEHAADWVLPLILGVPTSIVTSLIATHIQRRLDAWRSTGSTKLPTVRYREVTYNQTDGNTKVREIEGPADEVLIWLRDERDGISSTEDDAV
jgi:hypothetical protein